MNKCLYITFQTEKASLSDLTSVTRKLEEVWSIIRTEVEAFNNFCHFLKWGFPSQKLENIF